MTDWSQLTATAYTDIPHTGSNYAKGEGLANSSSAFAGQVLGTVKFMCYRTVSLSGDVHARVYDSSGSLKHTFYSMPFNDLPTSAGNLMTTPTAVTSSTLVSGDVIVLEVETNVGDGELMIGYNTTDPFDGVNSGYTGRDTDGSFPVNAAYDAAFFFSTEGGSSGDSAILLPPPVAWI